MKSKRAWSVTILIPVYNEIELLDASLKTIHSFAQTHFSDYEILLIESGSNDGSSEVCDRAAQTLSRTKVLHEGRRNGFGSALKLGYAAATKDLVWLVTVDLPFPLETILQALPFLDGHDCVFSFRSNDDRPWIRKLLSLGYNGIMRLLLGVRVRHINSAFRVFKRETIQSLKLVSNGWFLDAEVLYWVEAKDFSTAEIPVTLLNRTAGQSKVSGSAPFAMLWEAVKFLWSK